MNSNEPIVVVDIERRLICCNSTFRQRWLGGEPVGREDPELVAQAVIEFEEHGAVGRELFVPLTGRTICYAVVTVTES